MDKISVVRVDKTAHDSVSGLKQWYVGTEDGNMLYIRYRSGTLSVQWFYPDIEPDPESDGLDELGPNVFEKTYQDSPRTLTKQEVQSAINDESPLAINCSL